MAPSCAVASLGVTLRAVRRGAPARARYASTMASLASLRPAQPPIVLGATKARGWACCKNAMRCADRLLCCALGAAHCRGDLAARLGRHRQRLG